MKDTGSKVSPNGVFRANYRGRHFPGYSVVRYIDIDGAVFCQEAQLWTIA